MQIDTDGYRMIASKFRLNQRSFLKLSQTSLKIRHDQIQNKLFQLERYFDSGADLYEKNEVLNDFFTQGKPKISYYTNINYAAILSKSDKKSYLGFDGRYSLKEAKISYQNDHINASLGLNVGDIKASGDAEFSLWKDKEWNPKVSAEFEADMAFVSANLLSNVGTKNIGATLDARGAIGAVYAKAQCVLSLDEQSFEAGIGASALKGEASIAFNVFGFKVTLTGQASIGSAEANISYHHRNKEWEFGSKLGFIAGLGFKVKVNY